MKKSYWLAGIALMLMTSTTSFGQGLRLNVYGSGSFIQKANRSFIVDGDNFQTDFENGSKFGVRGTIDLGNSLAVEGGYAFGRNTFRLTDLDEIPVEQRAYPVELHEWSANIKYYFTSTESMVRPFVTGGGGISVFSPTDEARSAALGTDFINDPVALDSSQQPTLNFGGGIEGRLNRWLGLRFDVRDHIMEVPRFGLSETSSGPLQSPAAITAPNAAPRTVVSVTAGTTTSIPRMSAWNRINSVFATMPPSTRSSDRR